MDTRKETDLWGIIIYCQWYVDNTYPSQGGVKMMGGLYYTLMYTPILSLFGCSTVRMISPARFLVHILLLHHYKRYLAHLSDVYSLVIWMYKYERWAKTIKKWRTSSKPTKFAQFWVVLVRKSMVKKYLISDRFDFLDSCFSAFLW